MATTPIQLRSNLAEALRLRDAGATFYVSHSAGKDSQTMWILLSAIIPAAQLVIIYADLGRVVWGSPVAEDPKLLDQRGRGLRRIYGDDAVRNAERVAADLSRAVFLLMKEPEKLEAEAQAVTPFVETAGEVERALEEAVGRAEAAILPAALVEERPAPVARPAPPPAPRPVVTPPPLKPRGRPPEMLREAARAEAITAVRPVRSVAAQALLDSMKTSTLASVNQCLKKCDPVASIADNLTAILREALT